MCIRCATQIEYAAFMFMFSRSLWSNPPIASGRITRGRLAAYWPSDGYVLVPEWFEVSAGVYRPIPANTPHGS